MHSMSESISLALGWMDSTGLLFSKQTENVWHSVRERIMDNIDNSKCSKTEMMERQ